MKKLMRGAAALLAGWLATSTPIIFAQDLASGEPNLPLPLYHARPDAGGFFMSGSINGIEPAISHCLAFNWVCLPVHGK